MTWVNLDLDDPEAELPGIEKARDERAARELVRLMNDISEDNWHAGWLMDLEYILWREVYESDERNVTNEQFVRLLSLSIRSGGWWRWVDDVDDPSVTAGETFVTFDEWIHHMVHDTGKSWF